MANLILDNVSKYFGDQPAVDRLNLAIEPGEFVALLGPSGCGKTTMLRMLAGFETITGGSIRLGGQLLAGEGVHLPPEQRRMGMVFQSYALWPHMSVAQNVGYPLKMQKLADSERKRRIGEALEAVQLTHLADRAPKELSGGQRQRVALARCLVTEPDVVLLDEPLANLDRHLRASMEEAFREFHRRTGATMIYVTHDQAEAMSLASRIAVMNAGRLEQWSTPQALYTFPRSEWVAGFIGQGGVAPVHGVSAGMELGEEALLKGLSCDVGAATPVLIRPQDVRVSERGIAVDVAESIYRGERYELKLRLASGAELMAYHHQPLQAGQRAAVQISRGWSLESAR
ncbi:ABC transporter ATP-binding protein [Marinobacterium mangrovicola]|uniref:Carbohydrate ABC transporter ATP-binding protein (CUT1 family) n=1 Tax=Marinobacterium mangrovicola TaxID=1476959 RepID=A0A4R1GCZ3_9GAMM|nr:ABC transporter ATP-binding protein [Marinobacterium mangrovicola]TCK05678.1 carbohydrate ABC transporter ATP-binding protein (CUT1 family) [Marinobacterium mangrovicola]